MFVLDSERPKVRTSELLKLCGGTVDGKACDRKAVPGEKYCCNCRAALLTEMDTTGYLQDVPRRPYLTAEMDDPVPVEWGGEIQWMRQY
jgi:hypothetical protein